MVKTKQTNSLINPHDSQLLWEPPRIKVWWTAPAYHKKEGVTPHSGVSKYSLQYDERPVWCSKMRVGTWHIDSLGGKGEDCEELRKRMIDMYCLQEVRRTGQEDAGDGGRGM